MADAPLDTVLRHIREIVTTEAGRDLSDRHLLYAFATRRDEAAFEALVRRHGPTVLGVARRLLGNIHDAEDVFQATFLVLARRAASVRKAEALASWLHGIAYRMARNVRRAAARRRAHEGQAQARVPRGPAWEVGWREAQALIDEEIQRLPDKYRAVFVLCCLESQGREDAARRLGLKAGTVASRLAEARRRLQKRLAARGVSLSAVLGAGALWPDAGTAAVSAGLAGATARAATAYTGGEGAAGTVSARAVPLAEGVRKAGLAARFRTGAVLVLALGLAAAGGLAARPQPAAPATPPQQGEAPAAGPDRPRPTAEKLADPSREVFTYAGRVLGPDGKPLAGAKLFVCGLNPGVIEFRERAVSGPDGTFRFCIRRDEFGHKGVVPPSRSPPEHYVNIGATAEGYGAACSWAGKAEEREELTLWLPAEELVRGRIVDLEGKPVAGVSVSAYVRGTRADKDHKPLPYDSPSEAGQFSGNILPSDEDRNAAVSDRDGRFTLRGLGRGWLYDLSISGPTVVNAKAVLVARLQKPGVTGATGEAPPDRPPPQLPLYGSTFTHVVAPCKPIIGVVREKESGKPLAGVEVGRAWTRDDDPSAWATTDKDGRYRLTGLPPGVHTLKVEPPRNTPYLATEVRAAADQPGVEPVRFDIALDRQPAVTGRVTDRATGKPVQAWVEYRPLARNPNLKTSPVLAEPKWGNHPPAAATDADGRFTLPVLRGPGVLLIDSENDYLPARLEKEDRVAGVADKTDPELIDCRPLLAWPGDSHAYRLIDVQEGKDAEVAVELTPGKARPLVLEYPDGKTHDTTVLGLKPGMRESGDLYFPGMTAVAGLVDGESRRLLLSTSDGRFAAAAGVSARESGPATVTMKSTGTVTGRILDRDGKPIEGVGFQMFFDDGPGRPGVFIDSGSMFRLLTPAENARNWRTRGYSEGEFCKFSTSEQTDARGRFRLARLLPDVPFDLKVQLVAPPNAKGQRFVTAVVSVARPTVKPGETLDLGDLRAVAPPGK
jgi:RNA polymerase sigma factor (sigma-70 family)